MCTSSKCSNKSIVEKPRAVGIKPKKFNRKSQRKEYRNSSGKGAIELI